MAERVWRAMMARGIVPSTIEGRMRWRKAEMKAAQIVEILDVERPVEAELVHQFGMALGRHHPFARHEHHGVAGQEPNERECDDRYPDERGYQDGKPPEEKAKHGSQSLYLENRRLECFRAAGLARSLRRACSWSRSYSAMSTPSKR